jgi:hypothetical protein
MQQTLHLTPADIVIDLQSRGYASDFSLIGNRLFSTQQQLFLRDGEFDVLEMYHFPGTLIYGIESRQYGVKGILLKKLRRHEFVIDQPAAYPSVPHTAPPRPRFISPLK